MAATILAAKFGSELLSAKKPKLPPVLPMPDPEDPVAKMEGRRAATARLANSGRQSTVLSGPQDRLTNKLGG